MGYIRDHLLTDEHIAYTTKLHWIIFAWPIVFLAVGLGALANQSGVGAVLILVGIIWGLINFIPYNSWEFGVTNRRILIAVHFFGLKSLEIMLSKVESVGVAQGFLGTIFGYGTLLVIGTGGTKEAFPRIADPQEFRKQVQEQIAAQERRT